MPSLVLIVAVVSSPVLLPVLVPVIASSFVLSVALMLPAALVVEAAIEITGAVPPVETMGRVPVTPVTVPVVGVNQLSEPAVAPAVSTLPLLVVLVAGTCKLPSPEG